MVNRLIIHIKNLWISLKWIILNFNNFKNHLESKGYYSVVPYKIFLWKRNAKYFRTFNAKGACFFIKMKCQEDILYESKVIDYINNNNSERLRFFPRILTTIIDEYCYNIFEDLEGDRINRRLIVEFNLIKQMLMIISFFHEIKVVHRDIRPHNLIIVNGILKVLDFEHCAISNRANNKNFEELNKNFRPRNQKWDDAYSFEKILDQYLIDNESQNEYLKLSNMVDQYIYEIT